MAFVELMERQHLKYIISQNVDGLHRKSGIPPENMSELHGNTNLEVCTKCGREHMRDHRVRNAQRTKDHLTGRNCDTPSCNGPLKDTIINFGENLNDNIMELGFHNSRIADLHLVMGTSLRVQPAATMPLETVNNKGNLVICNLQKTPIDAYATLVIHAKCDDIMELLMKKLGYQIPTWQMKKRLNVALSKDKKNVEIMGVDSNGAPYSLFEKVDVSGLTTVAKDIKAAKMPYKIALPEKKPKSFDITLQFMRHYNEPNMKIKVNMEELEEHQGIEYLMSFDAGKTGNFDVVLMHNKDKDLIGLAEYEQIGSGKPKVTESKPSVSRHDVPKAGAQIAKKAVK